MATALRSEVEPCYIELVRELHDANHRSLRASIVSALDSGADHVVVDCAGWERLDLSVLSALVQGANACGLRGASFEMANLASALRADINALRLAGRLGLAA
jgi:anti-anti-sigma regulatory factor